MFITNSQNQIVTYEKFRQSTLEPALKNLKFKDATIEEFNSKIKNKSENSQASNMLGYNLFYNENIKSITNINYLENYLNDGYNKEYHSFQSLLKNRGESMATINVKGVEGNLIFDLNANNKIDSASENLQNIDLFALDSNRDGLLNSSDEFFDKLQVVIKDKNSEYKMVKLSNLVSFVNLEDYTDKDKLKKLDEMGMGNVFLRYIDPKYTYDKIDKNDLNKAFIKFANKDGWIELNEEVESLFKDLAYERKNINGNSYLQKFNSHLDINSLGTAFSDKNYLDVNGVNYQSLMQVQKERFLNIYNSYEDNNLNISIDSKREFERITNLKFSKENLEKVKEMVDSGNFLSAFKDMDTIVAMKKDKNGSYTLKFDSGRTVKVDKLYSNTGDFLKMDGNKRASILFDDEIVELDTNSDNKIDNKEINFEEFAIKREAKMQTLKDIGVKTINIHKDFKKVQFELEFLTGAKEQTDTFYKLIDLSKQNKINSIEELKEVINHPYQSKIDIGAKTFYFV